MKPVLIGYFPKRRILQPLGLEVPHVAEICSVSNCISEGPDGWMEHWIHNELGAFDSPEAARSVVPAQEQADFTVHAWHLYPARFVKGEKQLLPVTVSPVSAMPRHFERLGIDLVQKNEGASYFGCSPLSCNYLAREIVVNQFCLIDDEERALRMAHDFSLTEPEPGPYYAIEVWREAAKR